MKNLFPLTFLMKQMNPSKPIKKYITLDRQKKQQDKKTKTYDKQLEKKSLKNNLFLLYPQKIKSCIKY